MFLCLTKQAEHEVNISRNTCSAYSIGPWRLGMQEMTLWLVQKSRCGNMLRAMYPSSGSGIGRAGHQRAGRKKT